MKRALQPPQQASLAVAHNELLDCITALHKNIFVDPGKNMNILMVRTSHVRLGKPGKKAGFGLEAFVAPYPAFKDTSAKRPLASAKAARRLPYRRRSGTLCVSIAEVAPTVNAGSGFHAPI